MGHPPDDQTQCGSCPSIPATGKRANQSNDVLAQNSATAADRPSKRPIFTLLASTNQKSRKKEGLLPFDSSSIRLTSGSFGPNFEMVAPIAQLDRASVYGTEGYRFESYWVYFKFSLEIKRNPGVIRGFLLFGPKRAYTRHLAGGRRPGVQGAPSLSSRVSNSRRSFSER